MIARYILLALLGFASLKAEQNIYLGPEVYYLKRSREGGSRQTSIMYGGHILYDRFAENAFYWAIDGYYTTGTAHGKTGGGNKIKSTMTDAEIEGRFGYTLRVPYCERFLVTPYGAYGYFCSTNDFHSPSPIECKFKDWFTYGSGGLIASYKWDECLMIGVDFRAKYMLHGEDEIKDDPDYDKIELEIESMWQYELDLPIDFTACGYHLRIVPFYRFRHFGGKPNYPFDFFETKYHIYGLQAMLRIGF